MKKIKPFLSGANYSCDPKEITGRDVVWSTGPRGSGTFYPSPPMAADGTNFNKQIPSLIKNLTLSIKNKHITSSYNSNCRTNGDFFQNVPKENLKFNFLQVIIPN